MDKAYAVVPCQDDSLGDGLLDCDAALNLVLATSAQPEPISYEPPTPTPTPPPSGGEPATPPPQSGGGGGCLIATAAFGSELTPQVQFLRNFRDYNILSTDAGSSFMAAFNGAYYSFSPQVADYEREQPWLQQTVKAAIYPLLGILGVSEKAYSAIPGEFGALLAGLAASSMIGAVYFSPLALSVKKVRQGNFNHKVVLVIMTVATVAVVGAMISSNSTALMISTSIFVVTTIASASIMSARLLAKVAGRVQRWHNNKSLQ